MRTRRWGSADSCRPASPRSPGRSLCARGRGCCGRRCCTFRGRDPGRADRLPLPSGSRSGAKAAGRRVLWRARWTTPRPSPGGRRRRPKPCRGSSRQRLRSGLGGTGRCPHRCRERAGTAARASPGRPNPRSSATRPTARTLGVPGGAVEGRSPSTARSPERPPLPATPGRLPGGRRGSGTSPTGSGPRRVNFARPSGRTARSLRGSWPQPRCGWRLLNRRPLVVACRTLARTNFR